MTIRSPVAREVDAIIDMLTRAYVAGHEDFPDDPEVLRSYSRHDPGGGPENWVVAWEGSRPVSALRLFYREVSSPSGPVRMGGIGNVGTDPDRGGRGLASRVMEAAHARLRDEGIYTAVLVTDIPAFYARLGYAAVQQAEIRAVRRAGAREQAPGEGPDADRVLELPREAGIAVRDAHRALATRVPGRVIRTRGYWSSWIHDFKIRTQRLDALVTGDSYLIGRREEQGASYRVLEGGGSAIGLARLIARAAGDAPGLTMPDDPLTRSALPLLGAEMSPRSRTGIMALSLVPGALGAAGLAGYLELDTF